jgi:hypothetical protein
LPSENKAASLRQSDKLGLGGAAVTLKKAAGLKKVVLDSKDQRPEN